MGKSYIGSGKTWRRYTEEEKRQVRQTDMLDFLGRFEGWSFKRTGNVYTCVQHDSFIVQADRQRWWWYSRNSDTGKEAQGLNVLDYLEKIRGMSWQDAMAFMLGKEGRTVERTDPVKILSEEKEKQPFKLPERDTGQFKQVFAYLTKTRCIDASIVSYCMHNDLIYQEQKYKNCVFVGYDEQGTAKFAESKVTNQFAKQFNINIESSDKQYSFNISNQTADTDRSTVFVFEAPVDLLSHATMMLMSERKRANAENRPANEQIWLNQNRLSLSGRTTWVLEKYLERYPDTKNIVLCLDNDYWGQKSVAEMQEHFSGNYNVKVHHAKYGKDYNECLQYFVKGQNLSQDKNQNENLSQDKNTQRGSDNTTSFKSNKVEGLKFIHNGDYSGFAELNGERIVKFMPFKSFFRVIEFEKSSFGKSQNNSFVDSFDEVIAKTEDFAEKLTGIDNDDLVIDDKTQRSR